MLKNIAQSLQLTRIFFPRKCSILAFEGKSVFKFELRRNNFFGYESEEVGKKKGKNIVISGL